MEEARLERTEYGLGPASEGWFVVNVRDAEWETNENGAAACMFESGAVSFPENRGAVAGIAVFARAEQSPVKLPFQPFDNKAVVVLDKEAPDDLALRLACCWARWVARRQLAKTADDIDLGRIAGLIETARQALAATSKIRTALNGSKTQIDRALGHVASLVVDVEAALHGIEDEVAA